MKFARSWFAASAVFVLLLSAACSIPPEVRTAEPESLPSESSTDGFPGESAFVELLASPMPPRSDTDKSYTMPYVDIEVVVAPDGSMRVTERRQFEFNGDFTFVYWNLSDDGCDGIDVISAATDGVPVRRIAAPVDTRPENTFAVEATAGGVRLSVFHRSSDEVREFEIVYIAKGTATCWADAAELFWNFVGDGWTEQTGPIDVSITLPSTSSSDGVLAWGHGPREGRVLIDKDGRVRLSAPTLSPGQAVTGRVVFPEDALSDASPRPEPAFDRIMTEES